MSSKIRKGAELFVEGMDKARDKLEEKDPKNPIKTAALTMTLAVNPVTGPLVGPVSLAAVSVYGASRVVKKVLEKTR